jgi:hypothetical protein
MIINRKPEISFRNDHSRKPHVASDSIYTFSHGQTALSYGLRALGLSDGACVLCPDYICDAVPRVLQDAGCRVLYHPLTDLLEPDWEKISAMDCSDVRAMIVIHYFGIPQDIQKIIRKCKGHGWFLIEDNAHGFGGIHEGKRLGTFGDIGIASPYKLLPIPNGGLLYVRDEQRVDAPLLPLQPLKIRTMSLKALLRKLLSGMPVVYARLRPKPPYASQEAFREFTPMEWAMDELTYQTIVNADVDVIRAHRHALCQTWRNWTARHGLKPIFEVFPEGSMPLVYPTRSQSPEKSAQWFEWGYRNGIDVHSWPTLPKAIVRQNGQAMRTWERTVCFPVPHDISSQNLDRRLRSLSPP